jgi:hypothetical protein
MLQYKICEKGKLTQLIHLLTVHSISNSKVVITEKQKCHDLLMWSMVINISCMTFMIEILKLPQGSISVNPKEVCLQWNTEK